MFFIYNTGQYFFNARDLFLNDEFLNDLLQITTINPTVEFSSDPLLSVDSTGE